MIITKCFQTSSSWANKQVRLDMMKNYFLSSRFHIFYLLHLSLHKKSLSTNDCNKNNFQNITFSLLSLFLLLTSPYISWCSGPTGLIALTPGPLPRDPPEVGGAEVGPLLISPGMQSWSWTDPNLRSLKLPLASMLLPLPNKYQTLSHWYYCYQSFIITRRPT